MEGSACLAAVITRFFPRAGAAEDNTSLLEAARYIHGQTDEHFYHKSPRTILGWER